MNKNKEILDKIKSDILSKKILLLSIGIKDDIFGKYYLVMGYKKINGNKYLIIDLFFYRTYSNSRIHIYFHNFETDDKKNVLYITSEDDNLFGFLQDVYKFLSLSKDKHSDFFNFIEN